MANKGRIKRRNRFFEEHPYCCFCGGGVRATTIDHVPSKQFFTGKHRPAGLEFPACGPCNRETAGDEQVAALISRLYPDSTTEHEKQDIARIMNAVQRHRPEVLQEMWPSPDQVRSARAVSNKFPGATGVLSVNGPHVNKSIETFGVKLFCALHYHHTGRALPLAGGIAIRWYSNVDAVEGKIPDSMFKLMGDPVTLKQGTFEVGEQFFYQTAVSDTGLISAHFAAFRQSFAILGFAHEDVNEFPSIENMRIHRPRQPSKK